MANEIILTEDGSHTMISEIFGVSYHSHRGSIQETKTVFIDAGLGYFGHNQHLSVFEMGFGTGLNALMAAMYAHEHSLSIDYLGIEAYPVSMDQVRELNYCALFPDGKDFQDLFLDLHRYQKASSAYFQGSVIQEKLESFEASDRFNVIFFDAFAPATQEELWSTTILTKMFNLLQPGGILVTYCAKGQFKRNLSEAGFEVEALPGPPGKREMTRAKKKS